MKLGFWIFVTTEYSDYNLTTIDKTIQNLINEKKWNIGIRTKYKNQLRRGDKTIFYMSGINGQKFVASAMLDSYFIKDENPIFGYVKVKDIKVFNNPIYIKPIIKKLKFIKNKRYWGLYFQSGVVKINEQDFNTIINHIKNEGDFRHESR